jgi:hypothetical protein
MSKEEELIALFRALPPRARASLLDFAAFLARGAAPRRVPEPAPPPPEQETVVQAIKRLNRSYPLLRRHHHLARQAETLLARHMVDGLGAREAIDELERCYREQQSQLERSD